MKIGVDMDSVLADIIPPLDLFHNATYKTSISNSSHGDYDLSKIWNCSGEEVIKRIYEFYESPYFDKIVPMKGAKRNIDILSKSHTLILITSRPNIIEHKSHQWLDIFFKGKFSKVIHTNQTSHKHEIRRRKSEICIEEGINIMIEDHLEYALDCANEGIKVLLLPMPWNKNESITHPNIKRVTSWSEIATSLCI
ncbi:hypothetical protein HZC27_05130 [Candidatus Roizmanbacteria bacterium]|nr:hypothetical protein [Candidatus Roizmanbacteria bacterium]